MKKLLSLFLSVLMLASCFALPQTAFAAQAKCVSITQAYTYQYDITGDGQADELQFYTYGEGDICTDLDIYVNDKLAYSILDEFFYDVYAKYITLENGKKFLYVSLLGYDDDCVTSLYQYKNGKLKKVINFNTPFSKYSYHFGINSISVKGNTITVKNYGQFYSTAYTEITQKYTYKNGKFVMSASGAVDLANSKSNCKLITAKKLSVYKSPTAKKATATIPKNKKVKVAGYKIVNGKMFFKLSYNKKTYWLKAYTRNTTNKKEPFKNMMFGG